MSRPTPSKRSLPPASHLPALRRMAKTRHWSEADEELFEVVLDCWGKTLKPGRGSGAALTPAQTVFADMFALLEAGSDGNLVEGILCKRPQLIAPGLAAADALGLAKLVKIAGKLATLCAPNEHSGSRAKREAWYNSPAGAKAVAAGDRLFMPFHAEVNGAFAALLRWAVEHPAEFLSGKAPAAGSKRAAPSPSRTPAKARPVLPAEARERLSIATKGGKAVPSRKHFSAEVDGILLDLEGILHADLDDEKAGAPRREAAALLALIGGIPADGLYVGVVMNEPSAIPLAHAVGKRLRLKTLADLLGDLVALLKKDPEDLEPRLEALERKMERSRFAIEARSALVRIVLGNPESFFAAR